MKLPFIPALLLVLLGLALLASLVFNLVLIKQTRSYQRFYNRTRLDPLGLQAVPTTTVPAALTGTQQRVVFYGDSRAAQWILPESNAQWQFINHGVDGQTAVQAALRFAYDLPRFAPDIVVVQVGVNDLRAIPLFPDQRATIISQCTTSIAQIVADSRSLGATVILTTVFPTGATPLEQRLFSSVNVAEAVDEVNQSLATLGDAQVVMFDAAAVLAGDDGLVRPEFRHDFLHINPAGYDALNRALLPVLEAVTKQRQQE